MVFKINIEGCPVTGVGSPAVNSERRDPSPGSNEKMISSVFCNLESGKRYTSCLVEDCCLDQASSVAAIVTGEKEDRVRQSTGCRLTWRTTVLHSTLVTKVQRWRRR